MAESSVEGDVSVFSVHVVDGGSGLISEDDSVGLDTLSRSLEKLNDIFIIDLPH